MSYYRETIARETGRKIIVARSADLGLDADPGCDWWTLCDEHSFLVSHPTLALARSHAANPLGWCEDCMDEHEGRN